DYVRISLPATPDNHMKFRQALVETIQQLNSLNIKSAMNSGSDWLGAFYEVFLKYASWAQDLGIVLTPRHLTRWAAEVMDIDMHDILYDPTCGTGGFLVAAFDQVKRKRNDAQINMFKQNCLFGVEQESGVAALAVVNMIFRGDGKNNIREGNCFAQYLAPHTRGGVATARYVKSQDTNPPVTKVMMNPPFALKRGAEKEYRFVDQALAQMENGGILFTVLPYSAMCKPKGYDTWRKKVLLTNHTLLAVITFPIDIFYPIGVTTCGVFIKKGIPHPRGQNVLWIRAPGDGLLKSKGKRLPNSKASNELSEVAPLLKAFLRNASHPVANAEQSHKACMVDASDKQAELVPEAYLDQAEPSTQEIFDIQQKDLRETLAYLVKINRAKMEPSLLDSPRKQAPQFSAPKWRMFNVTDLFDLKRGSFHSLASLDAGSYPTISRVSTDNGCVGFYEKPDGATVWPPRTITVSSVTGDAFIQPIAFIATDNVVMCVLKQKYRDLQLSSLFLVQAMMNHINWRYSYGRQCYKTKYAKTEVPLPVDQEGGLDHEFMAKMVEQANHWRMVAASFELADPDAGAAR
ncbi:MAG: N-6 DNA methylase, partial [Acidobacteriia bacterium]|nr:N-6 DNA methylase [Terriglobia bacterium]